MTTSGGTGRPPTAPDARQGAPAGADRPEDAARVESPSGNGARSTTKASTAYEVAAALRAQASRAAQATKDAAHRVQSAVTTPEQDVQAKNGNPSAASDGADVTGAAAAVAATAPIRDRTPPQPSTDSAQQIPAASAVQNPPSTPTVGSRPAQPNTGNRTGSNGVPGSATPQPGYVSRAQVAPVAPAPPIAPDAPPAPSKPAKPSGEVDDTQVSLDAHPEPPHPAPPPPRVTQRPTAPVRRTTRVRKARLRLMRVDPWSVMKTAFLLSVAVGITLFIAVAVLWSVLDAAGVFASVGDLVSELTQSETSAGVQIEEYIALSRVLGVTTLVAVVDVVLLTALATLGAFLYNLAASLVGGLEVTLAEDD